MYITIISIVYSKNSDIIIKLIRILLSIKNKIFCDSILDVCYTSVGLKIYDFRIWVNYTHGSLDRVIT